jgi:hypothetical protein
MLDIRFPHAALNDLEPGEAAISRLQGKFAGGYERDFALFARRLEKCRILAKFN